MVGNSCNLQIHPGEYRYTLVPGVWKTEVLLIMFLLLVCSTISSLQKINFKYKEKWTEVKGKRPLRFTKKFYLYIVLRNKTQNQKDYLNIRLQGKTVTCKRESFA